MVLIDALYINNSGGFRLLDYLVRELIRRNVDFFCWQISVVMASLTIVGICGI